ncbi:MAG: serine/threonine protein kinase [Armatimonadetes bacterium]|nr:serine/threonine protein kinase [Anaerolineae bacterium]
MAGETILNGRYRLLTQYAAGGMAVIYKAVDLSLQRTVAVKVLRPSLTNQEFITRFQNEARAIANLAHPNIVTVHDVGTDRDATGKTTHYIIMEFVDGQDLKRLIRAQQTVNVDRALDFAIQICAGIGFAHRTGIVHADIKPQNILLNKDLRVKITDFGIAQAWSDTQPQQKEQVVWGSPHYYAPEQAKGEKPSAASDVYSIGIVIFEMLAGRVPYLGTNQQELALSHIRDRIPLVTELNPAVPQELALIIQRAMAKEPNDRFRMADQLGTVLTNYRDKGREVTGNLAAQPSSMPSGSVRSVPTGATIPPPPPPSLPTQPRQTLPTPPPPSSGQPTQRYNVVPEAPNSQLYNRPSVTPGQTLPPAPQPMGQQQAQYAPAPQQRATLGYGTDSQQYNVRTRSEPLDDNLRPVLDSVTLALAGLALVAVACLIPLYIAVLNALSAGG